MAIVKRGMLRKVTSAADSVSIDPVEIRSAIERRAEEIYHDRRKTDVHGDEISDWLQAEQEIMASRHLVC
jgi:hypothetical protein